MKKHYSFLIGCFIVALSGLASCDSKQHILKCPVYSFSKKHSGGHNMQARKTKHSKPQQAKATYNDTTYHANEILIASTDDIVKEIKLPALVTRKIKREEDINNINSVFGHYSDNKVSIQKKPDGKLYLRANSKKDIVHMSRNMMKPAATPPPGDGSGAAIAGGILGIIAIVLALGPYVGFGALAIAIAAIVLGCIGLPSRRHRWAVTGIVLGVISIVIALVLGIVVFGVVLAVF